ncbi:hypothetical protein Moror_11183 [Moniliophthora roreri MCA 2997]|nr:hypothetical protein Moror_11183 [Moniliophthora roreri MCA 2997]
MSNATTPSSSSSSSGSQSSGVQSPVPTMAGDGQYGENITYHNGLRPNPYQLLHLFNSKQYNNKIRVAADNHNQLEPCIKSLFFLRSQQKLFEKIVETSSTDLEDEQMGTETHNPILITAEALLQGLLLNSKPSKSDSPPLLLQLPNPQLRTPLFILTPLPIPTSNQNPSPPSTPLLENPVPQSTLLPPVFECLKPQFHLKTEDIPTVGGEDFAEEGEDKENQILSNIANPLSLRLRPPTPAPTPMTQLINRVSALCVDWSAISPEIAHSTCAGDASKLSLGILLETALTNEGLATLHAEGLLPVHALCQSIMITMMNLMTTSMGSVEANDIPNNANVNFMFTESDLKKVRLFTTTERQQMG